MEKIKIKVDVVSDVVCPWCYIGKRRLEKAIRQLPEAYEVSLQFLPFELNPDMPPEGSNQREYLTQKFGGEERYRKITEHVRNVAAEEGLQFDFDKQHRSPNTFNAHRLLWLAGKEGVQPTVKEALMSAYFEKGVDLTSKDTLLDVVASAGLNRVKAEALLNSTEGTEEVRGMEKQNYQRRISGVPFYIINDRYGLSGAQPSEVFLQALNQVANEAKAQKSS